MKLHSTILAVSCLSVGILFPTFSLASEKSVSTKALVIVNGDTVINTTSSAKNTTELNDILKNIHSKTRNAARQVCSSPQSISPTEEHNTTMNNSTQKQKIVVKRLTTRSSTISNSPIESSVPKTTVQRFTVKRNKAQVQSTDNANTETVEIVLPDIEELQDIEIPDIEIPDIEIPNIEIPNINVEVLSLDSLQSCLKNITAQIGTMKNKATWSTIDSLVNLSVGNLRLHSFPNMGGACRVIVIDCDGNSKNNSQDECEEFIQHKNSQTSKKQPSSPPSAQLIVENFVASPNPSNGIFDVRFSLPTLGTTTVQVTDLAGNVVFKQVLDNFIGAWSQQIDVREKTVGVYFFQIEQNGRIFREKLIKE